jgi:hypothetical protein
MKKRIHLFLFLICFTCFAESETVYFTRDFVDDQIAGKTILNGDLVLDRKLLDGFQVYGGLIFPDTAIHQLYIEYGNYNILLITEDCGELEYVRDYVLLEKNTPETRLADGPVEINGDCFDWEITVLVNREWRAPFTEDISQVFKVDTGQKRIVPFLYDSIRLYAED